jgi:hypothetical protein
MTTVTINANPPLVRIPWSQIAVSEWFIDNWNALCLKISADQGFIFDPENAGGYTFRASDTGPQWEPVRRIKHVELDITYEDEQ